MKPLVATFLIEENISVVLEELPGVVLLIDMSGIVQFCSGQTTKKSGYSRDEIINQPVSLLFPKRGEDEFSKHVEALRKNSSKSFTTTLKIKSGSLILADVKSMLVETTEQELIYEIATEIPAHEIANARLTESQAMTEAILEKAVEGIISIDKKGNIMAFNKAAEEMFGYEVQEVLGQNVNILMPSPYREEHDHYLENYHQTGEKKIIGITREVRGMKKNGQVFPIELSVSEINFLGETVYTGLVRDISEKRRLENEILDIVEAERRKIGHELHDGLGQMLSGIGLISQTLARKLKSNRLPGSDEVLEITNMIKEADEYVRELSHGLVFIDLEHYGFEAALRRLCDRIENLSEIRCNYEFQNDGNRIFEEESMSMHLYRIAQEAIHNALKHSGASEINVACNAKKYSLELIIDDNGAGFSGTEAEKNKSGIGISTMLHRAHILGGDLSIRKIKSGGTVVRCTIPADKNDNYLYP